MMKKHAAILALVLILSLAGVAQGQTSSQSQSAPAGAVSPDANAQKARALLDKMIQALGGQAYLSYQTMTQMGRTYSFFQGEPSNGGIVFWRFWEYPDKDRVELTKDRDVVYVHTGDKGYEVTYKGTTEEEEKALRDYLRRRDYSMEIVLRQWLHEPGTLVLYMGSGLADQKFVELVSILNPKNQSVTIGIDPTSYLPLEKSYTYRDEFNYKVEELELYGNYRKFDGILTPLTIVRRHGDEIVGQRFINEVHFNVPFEAKLFDAHTTYSPATLPKNGKKTK